MPALLGAAAIVALGVWQPWKKIESAATLAAPGAQTKSAAPLTEARQLTLKARALIDDDLLAVRENFRLAEELCLRATSLDPTDAEAWATLARVSVEMLARNYESTPQRREAARSRTERAIRLAPNSVEARLAMASYSLQLRQTADAERRFRLLLETAPRDARVALGLARALEVAGRTAEATEVRLAHPAFDGRDPRPLAAERSRLANEGRLVESDEMVRKAQTLAPTVRGYFGQLLNLVNYWGDLTTARAFVATIPPQVLQEDAVAALVASLWIRLGNGDNALAALQQVPRELLEEAIKSGPKATFRAGL